MKITIAVNNFCTMLHQRCLTGLWICLRFWVSQSFEYTSVLNMPGFCICLWFWIYQGSKYTRVLNMLELHRVLSVLEYFLGIPFTLISKKVILPPQNAFWTSLKVLKKKLKISMWLCKHFACDRLFSSLCWLFFTVQLFYTNFKDCCELAPLIKDVACFISLEIHKF